jgi:hypothetical protein
MIEQPAPVSEAPPPDTGLFTVPPGMIGQSRPNGLDQWGNLRLEAEKIIEENHGQNFIKIFSNYSAINYIKNHEFYGKFGPK